MGIHQREHVHGVTVFQRRPGGTWGYRIRLGDGKQAWRSGYDTPKAAALAYDREKDSLERGDHVDESRITFGRFLREKWLPTIKPNLAPNTWDQYVLMVESYVIPSLGRIQLRKLNAGHLDRLYADLRQTGGRDGTGLSPKSVKNVHGAIRAALGKAEKWGLSARNVAKMADPGQVPQTEQRSWTREELLGFLEFVQTDDQYPRDRTYCLWRLIAVAGLRRGEALALRWGDIEDGTLVVRRSRSYYSGKIREGGTKGRRTRRVPIGPATVAMLDDHRERQRAERDEWEARVGEGTWDDSGYVFCDESGAPLNPRVVGDWFAKQIGRWGGRSIRLHDLRHTSASLAVESGVPLRTLSDRLGHYAPSLTSDIYVHDAPDSAEAAAATMDEVVPDVPRLRAV